MRRTVMQTIGEITFGDKVHGDGFLGEVSRLVVDPVGRMLTYVVVAPRHESGLRRLVPANLIDRSSDGLRLSCTRQEYEALTSVSGAQIVVHVAGDISASPGQSQTLRRGTRAYAVDGAVGWVKGLAAVHGGAITHYLLRSGLLGRRHVVAVPIGMVQDVVDGVHIGMTKHRIRALPAQAVDVSGVV
jgi:hypothetical protein